MTVGLSLGAIVGLIGCGNDQGDGTATDGLAAMQSENGLSMNGLSMNGLSMNGLSMNGLSMNGLSMNGLSMNGLSMNGLSSTSGLMTTSGGRDIVKYMVKCAYPLNHSLVKQDQNGVSYTYPGALGVAPELESTNTCGPDCQERVSACMLAHVNNAGRHIALWLDSESNIGWGKSPDYPYQEGSFFGNLIPNGWQGYFCAGKDVDSGTVPGRLGSALASNVYVNPYSGDGRAECQASGCSLHSDGSGYDSCTTNVGGAKTWSHVVTTWRNFDPYTSYSVCANNCLGVASNGQVQSVQWDTTSSAQLWQILEMSPGKYQFINVATGKSLDVVNGSLVQATYTGSASQQVTINSLAASGAGYGRYNIIPTSGTAGYGTSGCGVPATVTTNLTAQTSVFNILPVGTLSGGSTSMFDPAHVYGISPLSSTGSSVDVNGGSTANGTAVQEWTSSTSSAQDFKILASGSNWKITMNANNAKCLTPHANGTANGTQIEIQDCNGSNSQAWTATLDSATSAYTFKNVASGRCLDVTGWSTANGTRMEIWDCGGGNNQKYKVQ